jgi:hypothetical protein
VNVLYIQPVVDIIDDCEIVEGPKVILILSGNLHSPVTTKFSVNVFFHQYFDHHTYSQNFEIYVLLTLNCLYAKHNLYLDQNKNKMSEEAKTIEEETKTVETKVEEETKPVSLHEFFFFAF